MTEEEIDLLIDMAEEGMEHAINHLNLELQKISTGKANTSLISSLSVQYYGTPTPLSQIANVSIADARTIIVQPWEKTTLGTIEKAIFEANLGITPQNDGQIIRLMIPPLTEERRKDLVKKAKHIGEESKVGIRSARRDAMEAIKKAQKDGFSEDMAKDKETKVQQLTDRFIERTDKLTEAKEKDILTI
jgi:ribosome recycling factor